MMRSHSDLVTGMTDSRLMRTSANSLNTESDLIVSRGIGLSSQRSKAKSTTCGPGLSAEQIRNLFEEFKRFAPTDEGGSGIGLAISRTLARLLHGDVTVMSTVGQGSTFTLWLPLK